MAERFRWGILGTGRIAHKFAAGIAALPDQEVTAVGSRTMAAAHLFALEFGVARLHDSYEALAADPMVDAIYIATPHTYHCENTLLCLQAGKAVLCEKPFAINRGEAERMVNEARSRRLFLMEAMWSRFLPALAEVRRLLADGAIGRPRMLTADFGFRTEVNPQSRLFDPHLGGGALLDVGIYPLSLAWMIFGAPASIQAHAHVGTTGVDERTGVLLGYDAGELALLSCAVTTDTPQEAVILGDAGRITIPTAWWMGSRIVLQPAGKKAQTIALPYIGNGYSHEAMEVAACVRDGKLESAIMPLDETLAIMGALDTIRNKIGLRYPTEADGAR